MLTLAPEAKIAWIEFHNAIERELANGGELYDVRDVASKSADNAARLATLFQIFEHGGDALGFAAFEGASRIVAWHLNEARRSFCELALPESLADAVRLDGWLRHYCRREHTNTVSRRRVRQFGPHVLRDHARLDKALGELIELDRVRVVTKGRRKEIQINPALLADGE